MIDLDSWLDCTLVAYLDEPPFFTPIAGGPAGCDITLVRNVLHILGVGRTEFVLATFGELVPGVMAHRWHINVPMFISDARRQLVDFSLPVWSSNDGFIVRDDDDRNFASYESIASDTTIRLAAVAGQVQIERALATGISPDRIVEFDDQESAVEAVLLGYADASVSTAPGNLAYLRRVGDIRLRCESDDGGQRRGPPALGAFSFAKESTALRSVFDAALCHVLGTERHLQMMERHGIDRDAMAPALAAVRRHGTNAG